MEPVEPRRFRAPCARGEAPFGARFAPDGGGDGSRLPLSGAPASSDATVSGVRPTWSRLGEAGSPVRDAVMRWYMVGWHEG